MGTMPSVALVFGPLTSASAAKSTALNLDGSGIALARLAPDDFSGRRLAAQERRDCAPVRRSHSYAAVSGQGTVAAGRRHSAIHWKVSS